MRPARKAILAAVLVVALASTLGLTGCFFGSSDSGTDTGGTNPPVASGGSTSQSGSTSGATPVRVTLAWTAPVDLDLEIWDADGAEALYPAWQFEGEDVSEGPGEETFQFTDYADADLSSGVYTVSVYFAEEENVVEEADATLTVTYADGSSTDYPITIYWEPGRDQYHAFTVDAATGEVTMVDEYIEIETQ
ncbi:MAG: hypothetical protein Kow0056_08250 [Coriobacteriia bacterium]